jgi:hypothetical protein
VDIEYQKKTGAIGGKRRARNLSPTVRQIIARMGGKASAKKRNGAGVPGAGRKPIVRAAAQANSGEGVA